MTWYGFLLARWGWVPITASLPIIGFMAWLWDDTLAELEADRWDEAGVGGWTA